MIDTLPALLDTHYDVQPLDDYDRALLVDRLIDALPDGHPDVELTRSGVWRGTLADWLHDGPGLVQRVPLVRVELADRKPYYLPAENLWAWYTCPDPLDESRPAKSHEDLPEVWWPEVAVHVFRSKRYGTLELALADASRRAIAWARSKAKETT